MENTAIQSNQVQVPFCQTTTLKFDLFTTITKPSNTMTWWYPHSRSNVEIWVAQPSLSINSSIPGRGKGSDFVIEFRRLHIHNRTPPSFFLTSSAGDAQGLLDGLTTPISRSSLISSFIICSFFGSSL